MGGCSYFYLSINCFLLLFAFNNFIMCWLKTMLYVVYADFIAVALTCNTKRNRNVNTSKAFNIHARLGHNIFYTLSYIHFLTILVNSLQIHINQRTLAISHSHIHTQIQKQACTQKRRPYHYPFLFFVLIHFFFFVLLFFLYFFLIQSSSEMRRCCKTHIACYGVK